MAHWMTISAVALLLAAMTAGASGANERSASDQAGPRSSDTTTQPPGRRPALRTDRLDPAALKKAAQPARAADQRALKQFPAEVPPPCRHASDDV